MMTALILIIFVLGYTAIALENVIRLNKAATALITGVLCWTVYTVSSGNVQNITQQLMEHTGSIAGILFFLLGAMTIVELIDTHDGFSIITSRITTANTVKLLWIICLLTFCLSAVLDNLTTTIVMVSLIRKIIFHKTTRLLFCGMIIIAANAGGVWSPIGDVTTTMLWIGGQVTTTQLVLQTLLPAIACLVVPLFVVSIRMRGVFKTGAREEVKAVTIETKVRDRNIVFIAGICILLLVPVFKSITHLPPFMGMLLGLGIMWLITEIIHSRKDTSHKDFFSVLSAMQRIDSPGILFFLGILMSVAALDSTGMLHIAARQLDYHIGNQTVIVVLIGVLSAIVDNVPLVAAATGMYDLQQYPTDHSFWLFLAYCAGTGGSLLIIGSAAGVAAMGIEKISFGWYLRKIGWLALIGYIAGIVVFLLQQQLFHF